MSDKQKEQTELTEEQINLPVKLTIADVLLVLSIVDTISKRQGFLLDEYEDVGKFHKKMKTVFMETINEDKKAKEDTRVVEVTE